MNVPSILVVDDEPDNFDVIETFLSDLDCELHYSASGNDALSAIETFNPDLILLDVMMPGIDGIEVCQTLKAMPRWQPVPIVMITALTAKEDLAKCLHAGASDFISKPVNSLELRARVDSMLRIKRQYDDVQKLLKMREDMVNMVVHDLRNPLSTVLLGVELLRKADFPREKQVEKLDRVYGSAQRLQDLIDDILKIALFESERIELYRTPEDLSKVAETVVKTFVPIAAQKQQSLVRIAPKSSPYLASVDVNMIHRTLDNLLSNAIKFSPRDSQIHVRLENRPDGDVCIQVADSGPGVPAALRESIFQKFETGQSIEGVSQIGLGLAFCKMVVEAHGGAIAVRDNHPVGSIFEILLPKLSS
ncbi:MAG: hybrid sensor histidine kinase/response regulator [Cyanobacteria bacterium J06639_1]